MKKNYIKEAEQNLVNQAVAFQDIFKILEALERFGNTACKEHVGKNKFFDGLNTIKQAIYSEYVHTTSQLLMFTGIGGENALKFARQRFEDIFGQDRYAIMQFLDKWGQIPGWYKTTDEEEFRTETKKKIKEISNKSD